MEDKRVLDFSEALSSMAGDDVCVSGYCWSSGQ